MPNSDRQMEELEERLQDLEAAMDAGEISLQDIREDEELRKLLTRAVVEEDMERHRDIYDRLAEV